MRIAVVDDDNEITRYLAAALPEKGLLVEAFSNGAALKTAIPRDTFDAVVIDWNMPGVSGIEIVKWATATLADPPPFLMMTSRSDDADIVAGLEAGASDYIVKPVTITILCARIAAAVRERSRTVQQAVEKFDGYPSFCSANFMLKICRCQGIGNREASDNGAASLGRGA